MKIFVYQYMTELLFGTILLSEGDWSMNADFERNYRLCGIIDLTQDQLESLHILDKDALKKLRADKELSHIEQQQADLEKRKAEIISGGQPHAKS